MPLIAGFVVAMIMSSSFTYSAGSCSGGSPWEGSCEVSNSGSQVDIGASKTTPGSRPAEPDHENVRPPRGGRDEQRADDGADAEPVDPSECDNPPICRGGFEVGTLPDVTLDDLASFVPGPPTIVGEPAGFGVAGLPANFAAAASAQTTPGTVLGWDVVVRFVPAGFVFDYGDGGTRRSSTGGATWQSLGLAQFSPTATSHVYRERGSYRVSASVEYTASVDFGSGWRPVPGVVTARAGGYDIEVLEARTALVDRTCLEDPRGPGC